MLRLPVADLLRNNNAIVDRLSGGIWPTDGNQSSAMSKINIPDAFDSQGLILPTAMVQEDGSFSLPTTDRTVNETFRIIVWQAQGRDVIGTILQEIFNLLQGLHMQFGNLWVVEFQFAGDGPNLQDQALDDAEFGWSRWQAIVTR